MGGPKLEFSFLQLFLYIYIFFFFKLGPLQKGYQEEVTQLGELSYVGHHVDIYPICTLLRYEGILKEQMLQGVHFLSNPGTF